VRLLRELEPLPDNIIWNELIELTPNEFNFTSLALSLCCTKGHYREKPTLWGSPDKSSHCPGCASSKRPRHNVHNGCEKPFVAARPGRQSRPGYPPVCIFNYFYQAPASGFLNAETMGYALVSLETGETVSQRHSEKSREIPRRDCSWNDNFLPMFSIVFVYQNTALLSIKHMGNLQRQRHS